LFWWLCSNPPLQCPPLFPLTQAPYHLRALSVRCLAPHPSRALYLSSLPSGLKAVIWQVGDESPIALLAIEGSLPPGPGSAAGTPLNSPFGAKTAAGGAAPRPFFAAAQPHHPSSQPQPPQSPSAAQAQAQSHGHAAAAGSVPSSHHVLPQTAPRPKDAGTFVRLRVSACGTHVAGVSSEGTLVCWSVRWDHMASHVDEWAAPFPTLGARWWHHLLIRGGDLAYLGASSSLVVVAGQGANGKNIIVLDTALPPQVSQVMSLIAHPGGATALHVIPQGMLLISGGESGDLAIHDLRMVEAGATPVLLWLKTKAHAAPVTALAVAKIRSTRDILVSASRDGALRVWDVKRQVLLQSVELAHFTVKRTQSFLSLGLARLGGHASAAAAGGGGAKGGGSGGSGGAGAGAEEGKQGCAISDVAIAEEGLLTAGFDGAIRLFPWSAALSALWGGGGGSSGGS
jgi:hypothetical protein